MGKRIIQQRRGRGSSTYRSRKKAFRIKVGYIDVEDGKAKIFKILNSPAHTSPIVLIKKNSKMFYNIAAEGLYESQEINIGKTQKLETGDIVKLKDIPLGTEIFNIEKIPGDGGKFVRSAGSSAKILEKIDNNVKVLMPSKKEKLFNENCRATIGIIAGHGRKEKPLVKAGKKFHIMKALGKLYPRTSAVKMNAVDHPFGSGRGKNIGKTKIAPRNAPPGRKVGLLRPRKTGKRK